MSAIINPATSSGGTVTGTGVAGRVALWSGLTTLTSDAELLYDSTTNTLTVNKVAFPAGLGAGFVHVVGPSDQPLAASLQTGRKIIFSDSTASTFAATDAQIIATGSGIRVRAGDGSTTTVIANTFSDSGDNTSFQININALALGSGVPINWSSTTAFSGSKDIGLARHAAGNLRVTDGAAGVGNIRFQNMVGTGATHTLGTAGASTLLTVGQGAAGADNAQLSIQGGSGGGISALNFDVGGIKSRLVESGTAFSIEYNGTLTFTSGVAGTPRMTLTAGGTLSLLTVPLGETSGGTGESTYTTGDILYSDAANSLARRAIGASARLLQSDGTVPQWVAVSGDVTIASGGAVTLANSGVSAGSYGLPFIAVDAKGRITSALTRNLVSPVSGFMISNSDGTGGDPTFALNNDLLALENLGATGIAARIAGNTWALRTLAVTDTASVDFTLTNGDGVSGNPTITASVLPAGVDHNSLANLTTGDPHTKYLLLAGRTLATNNPIISSDDTGIIYGSHTTLKGLTIRPNDVDTASTVTALTTIDGLVSIFPSLGIIPAATNILTISPASVQVNANRNLVVLNLSPSVLTSGNFLVGNFACISSTATIDNTADTTNFYGIQFMNAGLTSSSSVAADRPRAPILFYDQSAVTFNGLSAGGTCDGSSLASTGFFSQASVKNLNTGRLDWGIAYSFRSAPTLVSNNASGTLTVVSRIGLLIADIGYTSTGVLTLTNNIGIDIADMVVGVSGNRTTSNVFGIRSALSLGTASGTEPTKTTDRWFINATGTADSSHRGSLRVGANAQIAAGGSILHIDGGLTYKRTTFSNANYTALITDLYIAQVGTLTAARTVTLPTVASSAAGKRFTIKDESGTVTVTNTIIVDGNGAETIDGAATKTITTARGAITIICDGAAWQMIGSQGTIT